MKRGFISPTLVVYLVIGAAVIGGLTALYFGIEARGYDRGKAECQEAALAQRDKELKQGNAASSGLEGDREKATVVYRTITRKIDRIVERPVYRNVCLDVDGLRLANDALAGPSAATGKPDAAVPESDAARGRNGGRGASKADGGG